MLRELSVRNICGISAADLEFRGSLVAITGESGSGKSSLVRSLELMAGKRSTSSVIRSSENAGSVWGVFDFPQGALTVKRKSGPTQRQYSATSAGLGSLGPPRSNSDQNHRSTSTVS